MKVVGLLGLSIAFGGLLLLVLPILRGKTPRTTKKA